MRRLTAAVLVSMMAFSAFAVDSASSVVNAAAAKGAKSGKNVLVIFHASWCGWCHRFDDFLKTDAGKLVGSGLEIVHITVMESAAHKADENPGGAEYMKKLGGEKAGLPFMAIIDSKTKKPIISALTKSGDPASNMGYPAAAPEIAHFMKMLKTGAPKISAAQRTTIESWLKANAPK